MTKREAMELTMQQDRLRALGISREDTESLHRISMTLRRWFELECGDSNAYASYAIERDENGEGKPFMVNHSHREPYRVTRTPVADRETGARKRLAAIMAKYPTLTAYVQTDPRGCALYILTAEQLGTNNPTIAKYAIDAIYNRGVAIA